MENRRTDDIKYTVYRLVEKIGEYSSEVEAKVDSLEKTVAFLRKRISELENAVEGLSGRLAVMSGAQDGRTPFSIDPAVPVRDLSVHSSSGIGDTAPDMSGVEEDGDAAKVSGETSGDEAAGEAGAVYGHGPDRPDRVYGASGNAVSSGIADSGHDADDEVPNLFSSFVQTQEPLWMTDVQGPAVSHISHGITINDKVLYIKDLFSGDAALYRKTVETIDTFSSFADVLDYMRSAFPDWDENSDAVYNFYMTVRRKFRN